MTMKSIGIGVPEDLIEQIDKERAREGVRTGTTPSRSAWFRRLARAELGEEASSADAVEA
jgi:metal-responsive CopG/Arc/MetJ family transcriptional regulator